MDTFVIILVLFVLGFVVLRGSHFAHSSGFAFYLYRDLCVAVSFLGFQLYFSTPLGGEPSWRLAFGILLVGAIASGIIESAGVRRAERIHYPRWKEWKAHLDGLLWIDRFLGRYQIDRECIC